MVHTKYITRDHEAAIIGSINYDYRSMDIDFELGCFTDDQNFITSLEKDFQNTIKNSSELTIMKCEKHRFLAKLTKIISKQV